MSDKTGIEWTDATWNPIRGCSKVSSGCAHCYAEKVAARFSGNGLPYEGLTDDGKWNGTIKVVDEALEQPLRWQRPRRIFVNSMSDLFHENVSDATIGKIFEVMRDARHHTFQVLTKRPERMQRIVSEMNEYAAEVWPLPNVWLGVSVENQATANERIPHLLRTPAAVRWLSCEPLLGPVDFDANALHQTVAPGFFGNPLGWFHRGECHKQEGIQYPQIHWVVVGGESGAKARPMHPDWARSLRDQCQAAGVPFFFKQWGEWAPSAQFEIKDFTRKAKLDVHEVMYCRDDRTGFDPLGEGYDAKQTMIFRVGKKAAGRVLDGRTWDEFPQ